MTTGHLQGPTVADGQPPLTGYDTTGYKHEPPTQSYKIKKKNSERRVTTSARSIFCPSVKCLGDVIGQIPAIVLGACFAILDNVPYGLLLFHTLDMPALGTLGGVMFLESTIAAQCVMAVFSAFPFSVGASIVENVPFLAVIGHNICQAMKLEGVRFEDSPDAVISTILTAFALASIATGLAFLALSYFKLGNFADLLPKHVLLGCIGGMGLFISFASVGMASGVTWTWNRTALAAQFSGANFYRWSITVAAEALILFLAPRVKTIYFTPAALVASPFIFYIVMYQSGYTPQECRDAGWLFDDTSVQSFGGSGLMGVINNFNVWRYVDLSLVYWSAIWSQLVTIIVICFFSVIHAPMNMPALSLQTKIPCDLNMELRYHGYANMISGLMGSAQNYVTYSSSMLLHLSGMHARWASFAVGLLSAQFIAVGPDTALSYVPRPAAALFLLHVGMLLVQDGLYSSFFELDMLEYLVAFFIAAVMQHDFMQGLALGGIATACTFIIALSRSRIARNITYENLAPTRSAKIRNERTSKFLDVYMRTHVRVVALRGAVFFGNAHQVVELVMDLFSPPASTNRIERNIRGNRLCSLDEKAFGGIMRDTDTAGRIRFLVIDFNEVVDMDCTAIEKFSKVAALAEENGCCLVCAGMGDPLADRTMCWLTGEASADGEMLQAFGEAADPIRIFGTLNDALLWCEDRLLAQYRFPLTVTPSLVGMPPGSESNRELSNYLVDILQDSKGYSPSAAEAAALANYFKLTFHSENEVLWRVGERSTFLLIVRRGLLGSKRTLTADPPPDHIPEVSLSQTPAEEPPVSFSYSLLADKPNLSSSAELGFADQDSCSYEHYGEMDAAVVEEGSVARNYSVRVVQTRGASCDAMSIAQPPSPQKPIPPQFTLRRSSRRGSSHFGDPKSIRPVKTLPSLAFPPSPFSPVKHPGSPTYFQQKLLAQADHQVLGGNIVHHPVWNRQIIIHKSRFGRYYHNGDVVGGLTVLTNENRVDSAEAVNSTTSWLLSIEDIMRMKRDDRESYVLLQRVVLRSLLPGPDHVR